MRSERGLYRSPRRPPKRQLTLPSRVYRPSRSLVGLSSLGVGLHYLLERDDVAVSGAHQSGGVTPVELTAANSCQSMSAVPIKEGFRPAQITHDACTISSPGPARYPAFCAPFLPSFCTSVGSHSLWTSTDGYGRLWTANPPVPDATDACGPLWTACVHLRIRRLGIRVPPGVPLSPVRKRPCRVTTDGPYDFGSHSGSHSLHCDPNRGTATGPEPPNRWPSEPLRMCRYRALWDLIAIAQIW